MNTLGWSRQLEYYTEQEPRGIIRRRVQHSSEYIMWMVDGRPLRDLVPFKVDVDDVYGDPPTDVVPLGGSFSWSDDPAQYLARVAGLDKPNFWSGRTGLLVCGCTIWGCGSLSAFVRRDDDTVQWQALAWNESDDDWAGSEGYEPGPPIESERPTFRFDAAQFDAVIADARAAFVPA